MKFPYRSNREQTFAIVVPNDSTMLKDIQAGLLAGFDEFEGEVKYRFQIIQGNNNADELREKIIRNFDANSFDLIFSVGGSSTSLVKEITEKRRIYTPTIFGAVGDPAGAGLINNKNGLKNTLTGIFASDRDYGDELRQLVALKPDLKRVLLVYSPISIATSQAEILSAICALKKLNISFTEIKIYDPREIEKKIIPHIPGADMIISFRDNIIVTHMQRLIDLCDSRHIPLYASDFASVQQGAAIGFGAPEHNVGIEMIRFAAPIIKRQASLNELPMAPMPWRAKFLINVNAALKQSLNLNINAIARQQNVLLAR